MPTTRYDAGDGTCDLTVLRAGVLQLVGHDLGIRVTRFQIDVSETAAGLFVEGRFDARSLCVAGAVHELVGDVPGPPALTPRDTAKIEALIRDEVLQSDRYPEILFSSTSVAITAEKYALDGQLTIRGATRPIHADLERGGASLLGWVRLHQPDFGIRPYRSMLGALRIHPDVDVCLCFERASSGSHR